MLILHLEMSHLTKILLNLRSKELPINFEDSVKPGLVLSQKKRSPLMNPLNIFKIHITGRVLAVLLLPLNNSKLDRASKKEKKGNSL